MATSDRTISKPIVNILTKAQYQGIASPSADEFYLITDDAAVSAGTGISVNSAGGETIVSLDSSYGLTASDITTGTDTTNKLVSAKTIADVLGTAGSITDVQVDSTSVVSSGVANIKTSTAHPYNASSNLIATMGDIAAAGGGTVTSVGLTNASGESDFTITGSPVTGSGTFTIKHANTISAGTAGTSSATSGSTLAVPYVTYDKHGHITAAGTHTHTISGFATSDTKVKLTSISSGSEYPLILGPTSITSGTAYEGNYVSSVTLNPSLQQLTLKAVKLVYNSDCSAVLNANGYSGSSSNNIPIIKFTSAKANASGGSDYDVRLTGISTPVSNNDAANKKYVDDAVAAGDTKVTNTLATTTKYYVTGTTSSSTNTGTQSFDSGIYATTTAGQLNATTYKVNEQVTLQWNSTDQSLDFVF